MDKYEPPKITTLPASKIVEALGPVTAGSQPCPATLDPCTRKPGGGWVRAFLAFAITASLAASSVASASSHTTNQPADKNVWLGLSAGLDDQSPAPFLVLGARVGWIGGELAYSDRDDFNETTWLIQQGAQSSSTADTYYYCPDLYAGSRQEKVTGGLDLLAHFDTPVYRLKVFTGIGWYRTTVETFEREQSWYVESSTPHHHIKGAQWGPWTRTAIDEQDEWAGQLGLTVAAYVNRTVRPEFRFGWHSVRGLTVGAGVVW